MTDEALGPAHTPELLATPLRKTSDIATVTVAFLAVALVAGAWTWHLALEKVFLLALVAAPLVPLGIRSWRRIAYPDRMPRRWPENSPIPHRMEILHWIVYGAGASAIIGGLMLDGSSHHLAREICWDNFVSYNGLRLLIVYYIQDRKPLPPEIDLNDLPRAWMNSAKPIQSVQWGQPVQH